MIAVLGEIVGAICLRYSDGFTRPVPVTVALVSFCLALFLVSRVMKVLPVSVAYPLWAGGGTLGVTMLGILLFDETMNIHKGFGVALIVMGSVLINRKSERRGPC